MTIKQAMSYGAEFWAVRKEVKWTFARNRNAHLAVGKRRDKTRPYEKRRHLESGIHVPVGRIPQREDVEIVEMV